MTSPINVGSVGVTVVPDAGRFTTALRAQINPQARALGEEIGRQLSERISRGIRDGIGDGFRGAPGKAQGRKTGEDFGGEFARTARTRIEAALRALPTPQIGAATNEAEQKIRDLHLQLQRLSDQRIGVDLSDEQALAELARLRRELDELGANAPSVQVRTDTAAASAELLRLEAHIQRLSTSSPDVEVDVDTSGAHAQLSALQAHAAFTGIGLAGLAGAGLLIGAAIVPAAAAAAVAVAGIGTAALAAGVGLGTLALGFAGIGGAVKALGEAQRDAGKDAATVAARQTQVAGAVDQIRAAEAGLANARANAADGARRAADQVRGAELTLAQAQQQARAAQEGLTQARRDARQAMQDLEIQVRGGALAQRQANLDVQRAKIDLDRVIADPKATLMQRQQAQLSYEQAVAQLDEQTVRNQRLRQEKAASDRAGVNGSQQVAAAQQGVVAAHRAVADAQQGVANARLQQATQARQSAFAVAQAQQAIVSAQRSLQTATVSAGTAGSAAMLKLKQEMAGLSPVGQQFARFLFSLKPRLDALRATAQAGLLPGVHAGIVSLLPLFPQLDRLVGSVSRVLGDMFAAAGRAFTSPFWRDFFDYLQATAAPTLLQMGRVVGNLMRAFAGMFMAFDPAAKDFGGGLVEMTDRFADWSEGLRTNRGFQEFLTYIREQGPKVVAVIASVAAGGAQLVEALAPIGGVILDGIKAIGDGLSAVPSEVLTVVAIGIGVTTVAVWGLNIALGVMAANPVVLWVLAVGAAITALAAAVVFAWNKFPAFKAAVMAAWQGIVTASKWAWENVLKPVFNAISDVVMNVIVPAVMWLWRNVFQPVFAAIGAIVSFWWNNIVQPVFTAVMWVIRNVLAPVFTWLWKNVISPVFTGIKIAISVAWAIIKVIFGLIQIAVKVVAAIFQWLWRNVIKPVWDSISAGIKWAWEKIIRPIFTALGGFIEKYVAPGFKAGVKAVGKAWDAIKDIAKVPVKFVIDTVLNKGILAGYNKIAKLFKVKPDNVQIPLPKGFATGGIYPGYTPGQDVGVIGVSGGEAIMRPEWTRAVGPGYVEAANQAARRGGTEGVRRWMGGYADGGIVGWITKPLDMLKDIGSSEFARMIASIPKRVADTIVDKVKGFVGLGADGKGPAPSGLVNAGAGAASWPAIVSLARASGVPFNVTSTQRNSNDYHGRGMAVDMASSTSNMARLARYFYNMSAYELELIHSGGGGFFVKNGRRVGADFYRSVVGQHYNHVHVAMTNPAAAAARSAFAYDQGGYLPPGLSTVYNGTGRPEPVLTGQQWDRMKRDASGGTFTGNLMLEDGTFMGRVRGEMHSVVDQFAGELADARIYGG